MERFKRMLAMLLSVLMVISCIPAGAVSVFAADGTEMIETVADDVQTGEDFVQDDTWFETEADSIDDVRTEDEFVQDDVWIDAIDEMTEEPTVGMNDVQGQDAGFSVIFTGVPEGAWVGVVSESMEEGHGYTEDDLLDYSNLKPGSYLYGVISGEELIFWSRFTIDDSDLEIQVGKAIESIDKPHKATALRGSQYSNIGTFPDGINSVQTNSTDNWSFSGGKWTVRNSSNSNIPLLKIEVENSGLLLINYSTETNQYDDSGCSKVGTVLLYSTKEEISADNYSNADNIDKKSDYSGNHYDELACIPVNAGDSVYFTLYAFSDSDIEQTASISEIRLDTNRYEAHKGKTFGNLTDVLASAEDGDVVALLNDVTVSSDLTIPEGVTLLIPFDAGETLCTTRPAETSSYQKPKKAYRTLTLAGGAKLTVKGALSLSAKVGAIGQTNGHNASPSGDYGAIELKENSSIDVLNGGKLYAWGYVYGDGAVEAQDGATIYECFQLRDWRGGSHTSRIIDSVFPFVQYYVQNIEAPLTLHPGAKEVAYTTNSVASASIDFIGSQGMFKITSGSLTKQYDPIDDRLIIDVNGDFEVSPITFSVYVTIDTSKYVLPWTYNMTFNINKGKTTVNQDMLLLPGTELTIAKGAEVDIKNGHYVYAISKADAANAEEEISSALTLYPVDYTVEPIVNNRVVNKLQDASINLEGKINVDGGLYVSENWDCSNLRADEGAEICFNRADTTKETVIYAGSKNTAGTNVNTIAVAPVFSLLDNTTETISGDVFRYYNKKWNKNITEKASLSITSGDTTATAKVFDDYHAEFILPSGNVNLSNATVEVALTDVASLGISGTRSHTIGIATGMDDENVTLDADLIRRLIPGLLEFQGAEVIAKIGDNSAQYELTDQSSTTEKAVIATVDEDAARAVWHAIVNSENILVSTQTPGDSYSIIAKGSYIMLGSEKLVFEDNADNLVLDDFGKIEENMQAVRDHMKLVNNGDGNVIFLKAGTTLALDTSVATLKKDLTITLSGSTISFGSTPLATLRDETEKKQIVKDVLKMFGTFLDSIDGESIEVEFEFSDVVESSVEKASVSITSGDTTATAKVFDDYHAEFVLPAGTVNLSNASVEVSLTDVASLGITGTRSHTVGIATGMDDENVTLDADLIRRLIPGLLEFQNAKVNAKIGNKTAQYELTDHSSAIEKAVIATVDEDAARAVWHAIVNSDNILVSTQTSGDSFSIIAKDSYIMLGNEKLIFEENVGNLVLDDFSQIEANIQAIRAHTKLVNEGSGNEIFLKAGTTLALDSSVATLKRDLTITLTGDAISFGNAPLDTLRAETEKKQLVKDVLKMFGAFLNSINGKTIDVEFTFGDTEVIKPEVGSNVIGMSEITDTAKFLVLTENEGVKNASQVIVKTEATAVSTLSLNDFEASYLESIVSNAIGNRADVNELLIRIAVSTVSSNLSAEKPTITYDVQAEAVIKKNGEIAGEPYQISNDQLSEGAMFTLNLVVPDEIYQKATPDENDKKYVAVKYVSNVSEDLGSYEIKSGNDNDVTYYAECTVNQFGQFELEPVIEEISGSAKINVTLTLEDSIDINFYVSCLKSGTNANDYKVTYSYKDGDIISKTLEEIGDTATSGIEGTYKMIVASCAAKEMTVPVHFKLEFTGNEDTVILYETTTYSVQTYCLNIINNTSANPKLVTLCKAVLDYGTAAQYYFDYNTNELANGGTYYTVPGNINVPEHSMTTSLSNDVKKLSISMSLESMTELNFYVGGPGLNVVSVTCGEAPVDYSIVPVSDTNCMIKVKGIAAKDLNNDYTLTFTTQGGNNTVTYSPMTFAYRNRNSESPEYLNVVSRQLYNYYNAAFNYFN